MFADAAEQVANAAIETTKASKKAAKKARPTEEERKSSKTGLEGKSVIGTARELRDTQKKIVRGAEDYRDDAVFAAADKAKEVSF